MTEDDLRAIYRAMRGLKRRILRQHVSSDLVAKYLSYGSLEPGDASFLSTFFSDVCDHAERLGQKDAVTYCTTCGNDIDDWHQSGRHRRSDVKYCSAKCRQQGHRRRRVTGNGAARQTNITNGL